MEPLNNENSNLSKDPFQSPEWIVFLTAEAESRKITLMQMIVCLGKMNPTEFEIFEKAYLNKFNQNKLNQT